ncbi:MAG: PP2C family protein-serine/threonine phosphatase [Pseudoclavibacter sp.]
MSAEFSTSFARDHEQVTVHVSASSDVGSVRQVNEDSFFANAPVFLVADGMGGHSYGDRASQTVAAEFNENYQAGGFEPTTPHEVLEVIDRSNAGVQNLVSEADGPGAVAGTTLSGVALVEAEEMGPQGLHWMIFNIGDSRVYGWNGRSLVQITVDHSAVQEMVSMGLITADEALVHPDRNVITRAVGSEPTVEADIWLMPTRGHQVFLVCSDGLTKELDDAQISELILAYGSDPEPGLSLAEHLVQNAVERGGRDNVTVVVVESELANDDSEPVARTTGATPVPVEGAKDGS